MNTLEKPIEILLIEDNLADATLLRKTLAKQNVSIHLEWVKDGEEAVNYLQGTGDFSNRRIPDLIFLDLNLPKISGHEVLNFLRSNNQLTHIPVIVLSASSAPQDILKSYNLYANAYVSKPVDFKEFQRVVNILSQFWFTVVKIPHSE